MQSSIDFELDLDPILGEKLSGFISAITRMHPVAVSLSVSVVAVDSLIFVGLSTVVGIEYKARMQNA